MSQAVTIKVTLESNQAAAQVRELNKLVSGAFAGMRESVAKLNVQMRELTFNPSGILRGTDQATRGLDNLRMASRTVEREMISLRQAGVLTGGSLKTVGAEAATADRKLTSLSQSGKAAGAAFGDLTKTTESADFALLSLDEGAATAAKSVAMVGRAAASALPKLEKLSAVAFDPAGITAGADTAVASLDRVKIAAAEVKASIRSAGGGIPVFVRGGGAGAGAVATGERMTFRGGLRGGAGAAGDLAGGLAVVTTLLAAVSGKAAASFDNMLQGVRGNTTMSNTDAADMRRITLRLMRTGSSGEEIAKGYGHIQNMGYTGQAAEAMTIQANKMGIATHTNIEDVGQVLARLLKEYTQPGTRVRAVAETAHLTSAGGDMYLREFDKYAGKAFATGANSKVSMPEVSAMLRAMTQHGLDISKASTQAVGLITQMRNPTPQALKYAQSIGLGDYLGSKGLEKYQPSGILAAVLQKTGGDSAKIGNIFKARQGGLGASILTGMGQGSYDDALNNPNTGTKAAYAGKTNAIDPLYAQQMQQTAQAFKALSGEVQSNFIPIGAKLGPVFTAALPVIRAFASVLKNLLDGFAKLPRPVQEAVIAIAGLKILSTFLPLLSGFGLVTEKTTAVLGGLGRALLGGGAAAEVGAAGIAGMALPLVAVAAGVALFAAAWKTDFSHIREVTAKVGAEVMGFINSQFGYVKTWFTQNMPLIRETVKTALTFIQEIWKSHGARIMGIIGPFWDFIKTLFSASLRIIGAVVKLALDIVTGHWGAAAKDVGAIVANLWAILASLYENGGKMIRNALMLIIDTVLDFGKRLFEGMLNAGQQAINGIVSGIKGGIGRVAAAASSLSTTIQSAVTTGLDIHSPSRVMQKLGLSTAEGLAQGIRDGRVSVDAASALLATSPSSIVRRAISGVRRSRSQAAAAARSADTDARRAAANATRFQQQRNLASATVQSIKERLGAFTSNPDTPTLDKQEADVNARYSRQMKNLGYDPSQPRIYTKGKNAQFGLAGQLRDKELSMIAAQRKAKEAADAQVAQEEADAAQKQSAASTVQLNRELWQRAGGDMKAYFQSLRDEADAVLKSVTDKFGPGSTRPNAPAVLAATAENSTRKVLIAQQETDAVNQLADTRQQHDLEQGKITLAGYKTYLVGRRDAFTQYSAEWLSLDGQVYAADTEMQRKQLSAIEEMYRSHVLTLAQYKKSLSDLALAVPITSPVYKDIQGARDGAQNRSDRQAIGGRDMWGGLADETARSGGDFVNNLLNGVKSKSAMKSFAQGFGDILKGAVSGSFASALKNLITTGSAGIGGLGGGGGLSGLLGGLFGGLFGKKGGTDAASPGAMGASMMGAGLTAGMSAIPGMGGIGSLLGGNILGSVQGINGPVGGAGGLSGLLGGGAGLASLLRLLPWLGGGALLNNLFGNPLGKMFKGIKKLFRFAEGGLVPGSGSGDSVPAMLTPGEMVLPKSLSRTILQAHAQVQSQPAASRGSSGSAGDTNTVTAHFHGDIRGEMDMAQATKSLARMMERRRRGGVPG